MRLSVIVTTYNRPEALKKVLTALYSQTRPPDEILVADDGSGPETRELIKGFQRETGPPLYHIWQEDEGFRASRIRNKAILEAKGEYLVLLDGDCIPTRFFVADHLCLAQKGFFFQGKRVLVNRHLAPDFDFSDTASSPFLVWKALTGGISNAHHILRIPFLPALKNQKLSGIRSCNMGVFKQDAETVNGFNNEFTSWGREDSEFAARLFNSGILRKEHPFLAICYHLWHREKSEPCRQENEELLKRALTSKACYCRNGLSGLKTGQS